jgi:phenylalanyl-tRNA synthetase alpha chain
MKVQIDTLIKHALESIDRAQTLEALDNVRVSYLGKKGELTLMMPKIKELPNEEKKSFGKWMNDAKDAIEAALHERKLKLEDLLLLEQLKKEVIDVTAPALKIKKGSIHPLNRVIEDLEDYFIGQGFSVAEGPEVETDHYNFEMMNLAKGHPAREMHDSFYITETDLLRTHTSPVQAHYMLAHAPNPIAIISPGKTYRRDPDDATHSHQFMQCEGLVVGKDINVGHLKETLLNLARYLFGEKKEIRLRPSFFPFTEPSMEVDVEFVKKDGSKRWIEVLGAGMVHPNVLRMGGYDPEIYSGFAFGIGIERIAILKYGIDDIRYFYQNDQRFIHQFIGE